MTAIVAEPSSQPGAAWARRRDEGPEEFDAFSQWLGLTPRPAPALCGPGIGELAARNDWAARAQAYDAACELMRLVPDRSPSGHFRVGVEQWSEAFAIEAMKTRRQAESSKSTVIDQPQQIAFMKAFIELKQAFNSDRTEDYEWTGTPEQLDQYLELTQLMRRKQ